MPDEDSGRPELDSKRLALIVQHIADHHLRTLRHQQAGLRGTLTARPAAHEHHLIVETCHVRSPPVADKRCLADRTHFVTAGRPAGAISRTISRALLHTILRKSAAAWSRGDPASPALGSPSPWRRPEIPRFQWRVGQHDCQTRRRTAATFTLPVLDVLPGVAMEDRVRLSFTDPGPDLPTAQRR